MPAKKTSTTKSPSRADVGVLKKSVPLPIQRIIDLLRLLPDYNYVFYFAKISPNPDADAREMGSGVCTSLVPMVKQPDGSVKPMRASLGMMLDFMISVEQQSALVKTFSDEMQKQMQVDENLPKQ
jgi:hypothetical protein